MLIRYYVNALKEVGCQAVMPLAAPIGSNAGFESRAFLEIIIEQSQVPVVVDAGLGRAIARRRGHGIRRRCSVGQYGHRRGW